MIKVILSRYKWYRRYIGGTWYQVLFEKYDQGGYLGWYQKIRVGYRDKLVNIETYD